MRREERLNAEQKEYLERLGAADVALNDARRGIRHQAPEEAGLRESELGPAKGEGIGGLRTASAAGQANGPASPKVRESRTVRSMAVTTVRKVASVIAAMHRPKFPL